MNIIPSSILATVAGVTMTVGSLYASNLYQSNQEYVSMVSQIQQDQQQDQQTITDLQGQITVLQSQLDGMKQVAISVPAATNGSSTKTITPKLTTTYRAATTTKSTVIVTPKPVVTPTEPTTTVVTTTVVSQPAPTTVATTTPTRTRRSNTRTSAS